MTKPFDTDEIEDVVHARGRLNILAYLATVEFADFMHIVEEVNLPKGSVLQHLKRLEEAGYVTMTRTLAPKGTRTRCRLTRAGQKAFDDYIAKVNAMFGAVKAARTTPDGAE